MNTHYIACGRRCALSLSDLGLNMSHAEALIRLELIGFKVIQPQLSVLAELCKKHSGYKRGARIELAPELVDCSTLTKWLYAQLGIWIPRHSLNQRDFGKEVELKELEPWDLIFRAGVKPYYRECRENGVGHVGIVLESGYVLHAANSKVGVIECSLDQFANNEFRGARRILKPKTVTLESCSVRRAESSLDFRCYILQTLK